MGTGAADEGGAAAGDRLVIGAPPQACHEKSPDLPMERIGGLAVGAWANAFGIGDGTPMLSKDIDLRGTRLAAKAVVQALKCEGVIIKGFVSVTRKEPPGLGRNYVAPIELPDGRATQEEVLEALPWVDDGPDRPYGFGVEVEGIPLLDPLSLFIGKLHA